MFFNGEKQTKEELKLLELECLVKAAQKLQKNYITMNDLMTFQELEKMSDKDIYNKYKYKTFEAMQPIVKNYLISRYKFILMHSSSLGIPMCSAARVIYDDQCLGEVFERKDILN